MGRLGQRERYSEKKSASSRRNILIAQAHIRNLSPEERRAPMRPAHEARKFTSEQRREWARNAATVRWAKYRAQLAARQKPAKQCSRPHRATTSLAVALRRAVTPQC